MLRDRHNYLHDEYGDVILDQDNNTIIDESTTISINGREMSNLVSNQLLNRYSDVFGIARKIISSIISNRTYQGMTFIIPCPLYPMNILLEKIGFQRYYDDNITEEKQFLSPVSLCEEYICYRYIKMY